LRLKSTFNYANKESKIFAAEDPHIRNLVKVKKNEQKTIRE